MNKRYLLPAAAMAALVLLGTHSARAVNDPLEFLHALQENGYSDVGVEYLNLLKSRPDAPKEIMSIWDLEMCRCLRAASRTAYNDAEKKNLLEEAHQHLEKFIKENPKRPEAIQAVHGGPTSPGRRRFATWPGRRTWPTPRRRRPSWRRSARRWPRSARATSRPRSASRRPSSRPRLKTATRRPWKRSSWRRRLKVAMTDFYLAQAVTDPDAAERAAALEKAHQTFEALYQANRGEYWGLMAHYFDGRCRQEQGNLDDARAIYEEVLVADSDPESKRRTQVTGMEQFFAETEQYYLKILAKQCTDVPKKDYVSEAEQWRAQHKLTSERTEGYQAVCFDLAKHYLAVAGKVAAKDKAKVAGLGLAILADMIKVASPYQQDAIKLLRKLRGDKGGGGNFDEQVALADEAAGRKDWPAAIELYKKAIDTFKTASVIQARQKEIAAANDAIAGCQYNIGLEQFRNGKLAERGGPGPGGARGQGHAHRPAGRGPGPHRGP